MLIVIDINIKQSQLENNVTREYSHTVNTENAEYFKPVLSHFVMEQTLQKASFHTSWKRNFLEQLKSQHARCSKKEAPEEKRLKKKNTTNGA